ncbi:uncharacterized protein LTR77_002805 [Saxophila tyrrhenica]|uniref:Ketoreductase domain-containing protein n=1 Tax=Saxophila tyrrhenica TaxID=1690608 RepID=A0AAV9PJA6_9PEZI|nr:hypothetical protein LTR77_002805 [Saxophila tyrrhenica]
MAPPNIGMMFPRPTKDYHPEPYAAISPSRSELSVKGQTVLITGGATGIGFETAKAFAQAGAGTIAIIARSEGPMAKAKEAIENQFSATKVLTYSASITDHPRVNEIINEIGTIDILVSNAGVMHKHAAALDIDPEEALEAFKVNVLGPLNLIRAFVKLPPRSEGAERTVIYTSTAGIAFVAHPGPAVYNASKSAMTYLMRCIDSEYKAAGIRAFAFHPAIAFTDMAIAAGYKEDQLSYDSPALPAHFAVWLCSAEADMVKGKMLWAAWDVEQLREKQETIEKDPSQLVMGLTMDKLV